MSKLSSVVQAQYGEVYNTADSYEFIAYELLQYGSCSVNFTDTSEKMLSVIMAYPRALFVKERYVYTMCGAEEMITLPIDNSNAAEMIQTTILSTNFDINKKELIEFLKGVITILQII